MLESELIPAQDPGSKRLLIMLHGLGDSLEGYRWFPEAMDLPWLNYLLVNAPDSYYGGFSWYDFAGDIVPGVARSRKSLSELMDHYVRQGYPPSQITLGGFSQGCLMALEVGLRCSDRLAGIVGISGYVCEPEQLVRTLTPVARQQRLLMTHGTLDPMIPVAQVRQQVQLLKQAGLNLEWREFAKAHTIEGVAELEVIRSFVRAGYPAPGSGARE
jgi:phospholipase/carboxylesterase